MMACNVISCLSFILPTIETIYSIGYELTYDVPSYQLKHHSTDRLAYLMSVPSM
jgi:hypothetical protein